MQGEPIMKLKEFLHYCDESEMIRIYHTSNCRYPIIEYDMPKKLLETLENWKLNSRVLFFGTELAHEYRADNKIVLYVVIY